MSFGIDSSVPLSRRQMVQNMGGGIGAVGLASLLHQYNSASANESTPHAQPRAKRVIQLFMNGGPYGPDLFDPKPLATKYEGQRPSELDAFRTERKTAGLMASPFQFQPRGKSGVQV